MHITINEHFHLWLRATFNKLSAKGSVQYEQLQLAFFSGAGSLLASMLAFGVKKTKKKLSTPFPVGETKSAASCKPK